MHLRYKTHTSN